MTGSQQKLNYLFTPIDAVFHTYSQLEDIIFRPPLDSIGCAECSLSVGFFYNVIDGSIESLIPNASNGCCLALSHSKLCLWKANRGKGMYFRPGHVISSTLEGTVIKYFN